ncbi:glycosyltransferase family 2 protein [Lacrimispora indolis]|uniref:glycosyltransferase family 2 protein n=1 Tax=Lacrimispora indolis TaxID=69825 RepID=UPI000428E3D7|nr:MULTISPECIES: glycosyltransferase family 2 protein [Lachnospiraceae]MBE7718245.1 glycosyltransferase family 2 protein [Lacrimispora celerecrescens]
MVSVLLASYNGEKYIRDQLDSILNQTISDLTVMISDDLSADGTPAVIQEYEERYPGRVKSLRNGERSGSAQNNFFRLLKSATDEYVMLCDQDDVWLSDKAEVTLREMKRLEAEWGKKVPLLVHGDLSVTDKEGKVLHKSMAEYQKIAVHDNRFSHYLVENNITGNTVMVNKALLRLLNDIPEECVMHDWWLGLLASCFGRISYIDRPLVLYRQHGDNQVGSKSGKEQYAERIRNQDTVRENYRRMLVQAQQFLKLYENEMSRENRETLEHFIGLYGKNRAEKVYIIWKYKLMKSTPMRTLGQMFSI